MRRQIIIKNKNIINKFEINWQFVQVNNFLLYVVYYMRGEYIVYKYINVLMASFAIEIAK